ncbi:kinetochore Sim4 complex subunit FTA2-domain-containing protein [Hypoxylon sp. NC0597]|nr:kinetochore Sim4 complex subunit FTA2-domain-containing protein [Hypoxylon sp. NC0597]
MYPDWPKSASDLVPLPHCDGPKLKPFPFKGPQKITFLEYLGKGLHAHVVKIEIQGQIYALKLFTFPYNHYWLGPTDDFDIEDVEAMSILYNYSEPFNCECRAFGRLQEAGCEDLAVKCYGYLLLDEEHERAMKDRFKDLNLTFSGNPLYPQREDNKNDMRWRYPCNDGRPPPIRGIVKEFGPGNEELTTRYARRILRNVIQFQQLGIINLDLDDRQLIGGKISDLSTAITTPHFVTNPELNPRLTPEWISAMEHETFQYCRSDYQNFDVMVDDWNEWCENERERISVYAFPGECSGRIKYNLRELPSRMGVYSHVDPRLYDWRSSTVDPKDNAAREGISKVRRRLDRKPPRWYLNCSEDLATELRSSTSFSTSLEWEVKDGLVYPRTKVEYLSD